MAGGATATTIGAAASGGSAAGAVTAFNADMSNRQLHAIDKINAKKLSAKSNGKYSVEEIEEQLRLMGTEMGGDRIAPGTIAILKDKADFINNRTVDPSMPLIIDGNVAVEKLGNINIEIQKYILENTLSDAGWIPGASPYTASNNNSTNNTINGSVINKSAVNCANLHLTCISGVGDQQGKHFTLEERKALGEYFGGVSTNYARIAALATLGGQPEIAAAYNVASGVAALLEQAYSPSTGKVIIDNSVDAVASEFSRRSGIPYPVVIEVVEREIKPRLESARQALDNTLNEE
ncbi:hypothetical protein [Comamonas testosteroni]|uniref:hypothetical protein n=1 Tax=Comamonas testosteroni TaxID=285 RepID=UPI0028ED2BCA|nr:hypothetical protein [Comamonas testosteroni]